MVRYGKLTTQEKREGCCRRATADAVWAAAAERRRGGRLIDLLGHIGRGLRWPVLGGESCAAAGIHRRGHGRRAGGKEAVKCGGGEERWEQGQGGIAGTETPSAAAAWSRRNGRRLLLVADLRPASAAPGCRRWKQISAGAGRGQAGVWRPPAGSQSPPSVGVAAMAASREPGGVVLPDGDGGRGDGAGGGGGRKRGAASSPPVQRQEEGGHQSASAEAGGRRPPVRRQVVEAG
jgi:hypothetical protein